MVIMEKLSNKITDLANYKLYGDTEPRYPIKTDLARKVNVNIFDKRGCKGENPNMWFATPDDDELPKLYDYSRKAKQLCFRCPIQQECFDTAIDNGEEFGIWGGINIGVLRRALIADYNSKQ